MANGAINPAYHNNISLITVRAHGNVAQTYTDRSIDIDSNGAKQGVTQTTVQRGGQKVKNTVTPSAGYIHTQVSQTNEPDGGVKSQNPARFTLLDK